MKYKISYKSLYLLITLAILQGCASKPNGAIKIGHDVSGNIYAQTSNPETKELIAIKTKLDDRKYNSIIKDISKYNNIDDKRSLYFKNMLADIYTYHAVNYQEALALNKNLYNEGKTFAPDSKMKFPTTYSRFIENSSSDRILKTVLFPVVIVGNTVAGVTGGKKIDSEICTDAMDGNTKLPADDLNNDKVFASYFDITIGSIIKSSALRLSHLYNKVGDFEMSKQWKNAAETI